MQSAILSMTLQVSQMNVPIIFSSFYYVTKSDIAKTKQLIHSKAKLLTQTKFGLLNNII